MHIANVKGLRAGAAITGLIIAAGAAHASILTVGAGRMFATPSAASAAANWGDTIQIFPGTYGAAVWNRGGLTIEGMGAGVVITGGVALGKGLFVIEKNAVTIKNITFSGARNADGNGAGIRLDGTNLTVLNSGFYNNQNGILAGDNAASTVIVKNSTFGHNGACAGACAHALYVGRIGLLDVENSTFRNTQVGHDIKSRALVTDIINNTIIDGPYGTSSYLIDLPKGGTATITGNTLEKGPHSSNPTYAISIGEEGTAVLQGPKLIANNHYTNDKKPGGVLVHNLTGSPVTLSGNTLAGYATALLQGAGTITASAPPPPSPAPHPPQQPTPALSLTGATVAALDPAPPGDRPAFNLPIAAGDPAGDPAGSVPEGSTFLLMATLLGMGWLARRRMAS